MKHVLLMLCAAGSLATAHSAIFRVNNRPGTGAIYTTIAAAITPAATNDTILVEGSPTAYAGFTLSKQLVILGPGYFLTDNDSTQAYTQPATINSASTVSTAGGTISGLFFNYNTGGSTTAMLQISANNVTVSRNYFYDTWNSASGNANCIQVASGITGVTIAQNFIRCEQTNVSGWGLIYIPGTGNTNLVITNNILVAGSANTTEATQRNAIWVTNTTNQGGILFANNLILGNVQSYNCTFVNNIWGRGGFINTPVGNVGRNNVLSGTQFNGQIVFTDPTAVNLNNQAMAGTMFTQTGGNGAIDKFWRLAGGSAALTAGMNSGEAGPFGGPARYRLSGLPAIPVVWFGSVPTSGNTSSTLSVTFRARTIN